MSFRTRLTLAAAAAVAVAVVGASAITYAIVRNELRDDVDATLQSRARELPPHLEVVGGPGGEQFLGLAPERFGGVAVFTQLVRRDGSVITPAADVAVELPVSTVRSPPRAERSRIRSTRTRTSRGRTSAC